MDERLQSFIILTILLSFTNSQHPFGNSSQVLRVLGTVEPLDLNQLTKGLMIPVLTNYCWKLQEAFWAIVAFLIKFLKWEYPLILTA